MRTLATLFVLGLAACAGSSPPHTEYLLRADVPDAVVRMDAPVRVALSRVVVAPYLDQAGIVVETEGRQVRAARRHEWAEPLEDGLRALLRAEISSALGYEVSARNSAGIPWDYTVEVRVERLHGTMDGRAVLEASYRIRPGPGRGGEAVEYRFSRTAPLPREGYPGVVDASADLARQLAGSIATALGEVATQDSS